MSSADKNGAGLDQSNNLLFRKGSLVAGSVTLCFVLSINVLGNTLKMQFIHTTKARLLYEKRVFNFPIKINLDFFYGWHKFKNVSNTTVMS